MENKSTFYVCTVEQRVGTDTNTKPDYFSGFFKTGELLWDENTEKAICFKSKAEANRVLKMISAFDSCGIGNEYYRTFIVEVKPVVTWELKEVDQNIELEYNSNRGYNNEDQVYESYGRIP